MLVTISRFSFPHEAHIAKAKLESAGIPTFLADEQTIGMDWFNSNALGGVKLKVPESFVIEAEEMLSRDFSSELIAEKGQDKILCPSCNNDNIEFFVKGKRINFLMMATIQFPLWPFKQQIKCFECGEIHDYKT